MRGRYLAKFWCTLAWIEQYWNDAKAWTRKLCDYTVPKLKADFPVALDTAAQSPRSALWTTSRPCARSGAAVTSGASMASTSSVRGRRALPPGACIAGQTHLTRWCLCEIPSHRRAHLIKMNLASDPQVRSRSNWGTLLKARRIDPSVANDLAAKLEENVAAVAVEAAARALDDEYAREGEQRRWELEDAHELDA